MEKWGEAEIASERNFGKNWKDKLKIFELEEKNKFVHFFFVKIG